VSASHAFFVFNPRQHPDSAAIPSRIVSLHDQDLRNFSLNRNPGTLYIVAMLQSNTKYSINRWINTSNNIPFSRFPGKILTKLRHWAKMPPGSPKAKLETVLSVFLDGVPHTCTLNGQTTLLEFPLSRQTKSGQDIVPVFVKKTTYSV
jgi:hypothetical protein